MKIVSLSDTHGNTPELPDGDILIHTGDACNDGTEKELLSFLHWLSKQTHKHKLFVPGNHEKEVDNNRTLWQEHAATLGVTLCYDGMVNIEGIDIWCCSYTPEFYDWAFMLDEEQLKAYWQGVEETPHILVTHGPPYGILDASGSRNVGCKALREWLFREPTYMPDLHIFGHIHESVGELRGHSTDFYNVACTVKEIDYVPWEISKLF